MSYILGVKWFNSYSELGDHEIYQNKSNSPPFYGIYKVYLKKYCFDRLRLIDNQNEIMFFGIM